MTLPIIKRTTERFTILESPIVSISTVLELEDLPEDTVHSFGGLRFFDDSEGAIPATPTGGTITIDIQTLNSAPRFDAIPSGTDYDATFSQTVTWAGNVLLVRVTLTDVTGASFYKLVVTCNNT